MNLASLRSLTALYRLDRPFARLANIAGIAFVFSITLAWASLQMGMWATSESAGIDKHALTAALVAGFVLVLLALALLLRRHHWILQVVSKGITIKGVIQKIDISTTRLPAEEHAPWSPRLIHTHYAVVAYESDGVTKKARLKLPTLPRDTAITPGAEVELLVLPRSPGSPLLRHIFQNWARTHAPQARKEKPCRLG